MRSLAIFICISVLFGCKEQSDHSEKYGEWRAYAGSKEGIRYSSIDQLTVHNVSQLKIAWTFSTNDKDPNNRSQNQCNPIIVDGVLYGTSPRLKLVALEAATGNSKWVFDPAEFDSAATSDPYAFFKVTAA